MAAGRPTDYQPEYCDLLVEHMSRGLSFESFAPTIKSCRATLYTWAQLHPQFLDAKKAGHDARLCWLETKQLEMITGDCKGNAAVLIHALKCVERELYGDQQTVKVDAPGDSVLAALSPEVRDAVARDLIKPK